MDRGSKEGKIRAGFIGEVLISYRVLDE